MFATLLRELGKQPLRACDGLAWDGSGEGAVLHFEIPRHLLTPDDSDKHSPRFDTSIAG